MRAKTRQWNRFGETRPGIKVPQAGAYRARRYGSFPASPARQQGKVGYIIAWLLGVPIPILFLIFLLRGCN